MVALLHRLLIGIPNFGFEACLFEAPLRRTARARPWSKEAFAVILLIGALATAIFAAESKDRVVEELSHDNYEAR